MQNVVLSEAEYRNFKTIEKSFKDGFPQFRQPQRRRGAASGGGSGGGSIRRAKLTASAADTNTITGSLLNETTGIAATEGEEFEATLNADIIGTNQRLDFAVPRLVIDDIVPVYQHVGSDGLPQWYIATLFMSSRTYTVEVP
jgi:hypothetical protein